MTDKERLKLGYIIIGKREAPCLQCKTLTKRIDVSFEAHLCTEECAKGFTKELADKL